MYGEVKYNNINIYVMQFNCRLPWNVPIVVMQIRNKHDIYDLQFQMLQLRKKRALLHKYTDMTTSRNPQ